MLAVENPGDSAADRQKPVMNDVEMTALTNRYFVHFDSSTGGKNSEMCGFDIAFMIFAIVADLSVDQYSSLITILEIATEKTIAYLLKMLFILRKRLRKQLAV